VRALRFLVVALAALAAVPALGDDAKKDDVYLPDTTEKVEVKDIALRVTRPGKDWSFLNLETLNKKELEKAQPGQQQRIQEAQERLKVREFYGSANANFYVFSWKDDRENLDLEKLGNEQLDATQGALKDKGKVLASAKTKLGKHEAWGFDVEGALASGGNSDVLAVSKLVIYRAEDKRVFVLSLEYPKAKADLVKKVRSKLFTNVQL
jgi:hypothetical protein